MLIGQVAAGVPAERNAMCGIIPAVVLLEAVHQRIKPLAVAGNAERAASNPNAHVIRDREASAIDPYHQTARSMSGVSTSQIA